MYSPASTRVPHALQNAAPSGSSRPQTGQRGLLSIVLSADGGTRVPHSLQNAAPSANSIPQLGQNISKHRSSIMTVTLYRNGSIGRYRTLRNHSQVGNAPTGFIPDVADAARLTLHRPRSLNPWLCRFASRCPYPHGRGQRPHGRGPRPRIRCPVPPS